MIKEDAAFATIGGNGNEYDVDDNYEGRMRGSRKDDDSLVRCWWQL